MAAAVVLFQASARAGSIRAAPTWQAHPLSRLLLAQPAAAAPLLEAVTGLLAGAPRRPGLDSERAGEAAAGLHAVAPFLSFALLEPDPAGARPLSAHPSRCANTVAGQQRHGMLLGRMRAWLKATWHATLLAWATRLQLHGCRLLKSAGFPCTAGLLHTDTYSSHRRPC